MDNNEFTWGGNFNICIQNASTTPFSAIELIKLLGQGLELEALFSKIDTDGSGSLSQEEVITYLKSITDDISEKNVKTIFEGLDTSGDKKVDLEEFKVQSIQLWKYLDTY